MKILNLGNLKDGFLDANNVMKNLIIVYNVRRLIRKIENYKLLYVNSRKGTMKIKNLNVKLLLYFGKKNKGWIALFLGI